MAFISSLDDMKSLQRKIDRKANDLFKEKAGQAPLTVTRNINSYEARSERKYSSCFEADKAVSSIADIKRLRNVRIVPSLI